MRKIGGNSEAINYTAPDDWAVENGFVQPVRIEGDVAFISLTQNLETLVDVADLPRLAGCRMFYRNWRDTLRYCVARPLGTRNDTLIHRILLGAPKGMHVDHIDGDGLNNRRSNLRLATPAQNSWNTGLMRTNASGHKGVSWRADRRKWQVHICIGDKRLSLGHYTDLLAAADAYAAAARKYHGEFANLGNNSKSPSRPAMPKEEDTHG